MFKASSGAESNLETFGQNISQSQHVAIITDPKKPELDISNVASSSKESSKFDEPATQQSQIEFVTASQSVPIIQVVSKLDNSNVKPIDGDNEISSKDELSETNFEQARIRTDQIQLGLNAFDKAMLPTTSTGLVNLPMFPPATVNADNFVTIKKQSFEVKKGSRKRKLDQSESRYTCDWPGCSFSTIYKLNVRRHIVARHLKESKQSQSFEQSSNI